jgi:hypothetical protein
MHVLFMAEDKLSPSPYLARASCITFTNSVAKDFHPTFLLRGAVCVEIDNFPITKSYTESFLDEHIALLFF